MKVVILAGGFGTRISEESHLVPKPMIKIGGKPILWHIMQYYASYGHKDFIILAGYKQEVIKDYFNNYYLHNSDLRFNLKNQTKELVKSYSDDWIVTVLDTGLYSRLGVEGKRVKRDVGGVIERVDFSDLVGMHLNVLRYLERLVRRFN